MRPNSLFVSLTLVATMAMPFLFAAPAQAQSARTWVSGTGNDANPCSRTAPCQTWVGAFSKTAAGGEIDALDAGGFGPLTITQSITIDGGGGQVASTLAAGTNGIIVSAGATDIVVLRNLRFQGSLGNGSGGSPGLSAIAFNSGAQLIVDNCDIIGFSTDGIHISGNNGFVAVNNTRITNVGHAGIVALGSGAQIEADNVRIYGSQFGVGLVAGNTMVFSHSVSSKATYGVEADGGGSLFVDNSVMSYNSNGVWVSSGAQVAIANSDITFNTVAIGGGGTAQSYVNNRAFGNGSSNAPSVIGTTSNPSGQL
jgi:hypothetical protein